MLNADGTVKKQDGAIVYSTTRSKALSRSTARGPRAEGRWHADVVEHGTSVMREVGCQGCHVAKELGLNPPATKTPYGRFSLRHAPDLRRRTARDAALAATSGRTATTMAMGKGSTQHQHLIQTEVPKKLLEEWLAMWTRHYKLPGRLRVQMRPQRAGSELLELGVYDEGEEKLANVIFAPIHDRRGRSILSVRDQNTFADSLRKKRLMTLVHLFLVHRFKAASVHYVTPTEDNQYQVAKMRSHGIFSEVNTEVGQIIVAHVNRQRISEFLAPDQEALRRLIRKER